MNCYIFCVVLILLFQQQNAQKSGKYGSLKCRRKCKLLRKCDPFLEMLRNFDPSARRKVKEAKCGRENYRVKVCCPDPPQENGYDYFPDNCGDNPIDAGNIINGNETMMGEFPWAAALGYLHIEKKLTEFMCSGSLINARYVLTAAHCLDPNKIPDGYSELSVVRLGDWNLKTKQDCFDTNTDGKHCAPPYIDTKPEKTMQHLMYNNRTELAADIALIRLDRTIHYDGKGYIMPICLPSFGVSTKLIGLGRKLLVIGWGVTDIYNQKTSSILLKAQLPFAKEHDCRRIYGSDFGENQLCVGGTKMDSCLGDSGGALMLSGKDGPPYLQVGIVSFGKSCAAVGIPAIYTEVSAYKEWIKSKLEPWE